MKDRWLFSLLVGCLFLVCCKNQDVSVEEEFQEELNYIVSSKFNWIPGVSLSVYAPEDSVIWTGTAGVSDLKSNSNFVVNQPFRIASVSKTFVATTVLRLHEEGKLDIDYPISEYISDQHLTLLEADGYQPSNITIRHCLNHTSGLYDYVFGTSDQLSPFISIIRAQPQKKWTRTELLESAMNWGDPLRPSGQGYSYGDTGYILLGEIIENSTGLTLGEALETFIDYEKLGLHSTWLESVQPPKNELPLVSCYYEREDFSQIDASTDLFGGGGLISTTADLSKFFYCLFNGQIFKNPETLDLMLSSTEKPEEIVSYKLGIKATRVFGHFIYGHDGLWDVFAYYSPVNNAAIAVRFTDGANDLLLKRIICILNEYQD